MQFFALKDLEPRFGKRSTYTSPTTLSLLYFSVLTPLLNIQSVMYVFMCKLKTLSYTFFRFVYVEPCFTSGV